jgi:hypothetical protein
MKALALISLLLLGLGGCSARSAKTEAVAAQAPQVIKELTNQTTIYECPTCHMEYDRAGNCNMCNVALVETRVDYICPADNKPVEHAGKCPRCEVNARIVKTAMTPNPQGAASGN